MRPAQNSKHKAATTIGPMCLISVIWQGSIMCVNLVFSQNIIQYRNFTVFGIKFIPVLVLWLSMSKLWYLWVKSWYITPKSSKNLWSNIKDDKIKFWGALAENFSLKRQIKAKLSLETLISTKTSISSECFLKIKINTFWLNNTNKDNIKKTLISIGFRTKLSQTIRQDDELNVFTTKVTSRSQVKNFLS